MRWVTTSQPKHGQERIRLVFAWWPTRVDEYIVFLEIFRVREQYIGAGYADHGWIELSRSVCPYQQEHL